MPPKLRRNTSTVLSGSIATAVEHGDLPGSGKLFGISDNFPKLVELDLPEIDRNPDQPRKHFDEVELQALAESIKGSGLLQPILVKKQESGRFLLVAGERRLRAHQLLGLATIPAVITSGDAEELALIENTQRVDLTPIELASAYQRLIEVKGYTHDALSDVVNRSRADVSATLSILTLAPSILDELSNGVHVARSLLVELAAVPGHDLQVKLWDEVKAGLTVNALRERKRAVSNKAPAEATGRELQILGKSLLKVGKELNRLQSLRDRMAPEHREQIRKMRDALDNLLAD